MAPLHRIEDIGGTPSWFITYKDQAIVTIGCTQDTNSQHPGWESLITVLGSGCTYLYLKLDPFFAICFKYNLLYVSYSL
jgi:hypothetical protein